ncbi:MAG: hypothetical protein KJ067_17665 [Vicinamibacteria bacterium]|jgi:hypothetical protein|nr:hypothetical protein [Vicinamibacteria bacterium]
MSGRSAGAAAAARVARARRGLRPGLLAGLALGALAAFQVVALRHLWAPGLPLGWDSVGHFLKVVHVVEELWPAGEPDGWFPYWHGGFQLFQFYPPGFYYCVAALAVALGPEPAFKLAIVAALLALPPATFALLRELGLDRVTSVTAAALSVFAGSYFGGLSGALTLGLIPNAAGFALFPLVLALWHRASTRPGPHAALAAGTALGLLLLVHTFSAWIALFALAVHGAHRASRRGLVRVLPVAVAVSLVAVSLAAFWLLPMLVRYGERGPIGAWTAGTPEQTLLAHLRGEIVRLPTLSALGWLGLARAMTRRHAGSRYLAWLAVAGLALAFNLPNRFLPFAEVLGSSQHVRFHPLLAWLWALLGAIALGEAARIARAGWGAWQRRRQRRPAALAALAALGLAVAVPRLHAEIRAEWSAALEGFKVESDVPALSAVAAAAAWMGRAVPPEERVLAEFSWRLRADFGTPHVLDQWVALRARRMDLGGGFAEGTRAAAPTLGLAQSLAAPAHDLESQLRAYGVGWVVVITPEATAALRARPGWQPAFVAEPVHVFRVPAPEAGAPGPLPLQRSGLHRLTAAVRTVEPATEVVLSVGHAPNWHAFLDGRGVEARPSDRNLVAVSVPRPGRHHLELRYEWTWWERAARAWSLLAALIVVGGRLAPESAWRALARGAGSPRGRATANGASLAEPPQRT